MIRPMRHVMLLGPFAFVCLAQASIAGASAREIPNDAVMTCDHWPEFNHVLNRGRVEASDINGSLHATFRGGTEDFNRVLEALAKSKARRKLVVIRPGGGDGELEGKPVATWKLKLPGDFKAADDSPSLELRLGGGGFDLGKIEWPTGVEPKELKDLYDPLKVLQRGKWSGMNPYSLVGDMIVDEDAVLPYLLRPLVDRNSSWQDRTGACYSLGRLGAKARVAREALSIVAEQDGEDVVRRAAEEAIRRIDDPARNRAHEQAKRTIADYMRRPRKSDRPTQDEASAVRLPVELTHGSQIARVITEHAP